MHLLIAGNAFELLEMFGEEGGDDYGLFGYLLLLFLFLYVKNGLFDDSWTKGVDDVHHVLFTGHRVWHVFKDGILVWLLQDALPDSDSTKIFVSPNK